MSLLPEKFQTPNGTWFLDWGRSRSNKSKSCLAVNMVTASAATLQVLISRPFFSYCSLVLKQQNMSCKLLWRVKGFGFDITFLHHAFFYNNEDGGRVPRSRKELLKCLLGSRVMYPSFGLLFPEALAVPRLPSCPALDQVTEFVLRECGVLAALCSDFRAILHASCLVLSCWPCGVSLPGLENLNMLFLYILCSNFPLFSKPILETVAGLGTLYFEMCSCWNEENCKWCVMQLTLMYVAFSIIQKYHCGFKVNFFSSVCFPAGIALHVHTTSAAVSFLRILTKLHLIDFLV